MRQAAGFADEFCRQAGVLQVFGVAADFLAAAFGGEFGVFALEGCPVAAPRQAFEPFVADGFTHRAVALAAEELGGLDVVARFGGAQYVFVEGVVVQCFCRVFAAAGGRQAEAAGNVGR